MLLVPDTQAQTGKTMRYEKITLTVAFEDYGSETYTALDAIVPTLQEHAPSEVMLLDYDAEQLELVVKAAKPVGL